MDLEAQISTKLDERFDQIEGKIEQQSNVLSSVYNNIGSVISAM